VHNFDPSKLKAKYRKLAPETDPLAEIDRLTRMLGYLRRHGEDWAPPGAGWSWRGAFEMAKSSWRDHNLVMAMRDDSALRYCCGQVFYRTNWWPASWCVDESGRVVEFGPDRYRGDRYFGVVFSDDTIERLTNQRVPASQWLDFLAAEEAG
jgi:hypothetical protein